MLFFNSRVSAVYRSRFNVHQLFDSYLHDMGLGLHMAGYYDHLVLCGI